MNNLKKLYIIALSSIALAQGSLYAAAEPISSYDELGFDQAAQDGDVDSINDLLALETDVNMKNKIGQAPLHIAACYGQIKVVQLLLKKGANHNLPDKNGKTPLHYAAYRGQTKAMQLLIDSGADFNLPDENGWTPLFYAVQGRYIDSAKALLAIPLAKDRINHQDNDGKTPLHIAAMNGNPEIVCILLEAGATNNILDKGGKAPCDYSNSGLIYEIFCPPSVVPSIKSAAESIVVSDVSSDKKEEESTPSSTIEELPDTLIQNEVAPKLSNSTLRQLAQTSKHFAMILSDEIKKRSPLEYWSQPIIEYRELVGNKDIVATVAFYPNGKLLASGHLNDKFVHLWDVAQAARYIYFSTGYNIRFIAFSPDGETLAASAFDSPIIQLWDIAACKCKKALNCHSESTSAPIAFSPDGKILAYGSDQTITLWSIPSGKCQQILTGHTDYVYSLAFSRNGLLATGTYDSSKNYCDDPIKFWKIEKNFWGNPEYKCARTWELKDKAYSMAFSPYGQLLAYASGREIKLLNVTEDTEGKLIIKLVQILKGHTDSVDSLAFSPDGKLLASGSDDHTIRLWNIRTGQSKTLTGHTDWVNSVAFSPDGKLLASGSSDKTIKLWHARK